MSAFRIRLTETKISKSEVTCEIEAETPNSAAAMLAAAYYKATSIGSSIIVLPDGQREVIDSPHAASVSVVYSLLNSAGEVEQEISKTDMNRSLI